MQLTAQELALVEKYASIYQVPLAACLAFMEVEANGVTGTIVGGVMKAVIRWEGHYFDRLVPPKLQALARKAGLASPKVGGVKNPKDQTSRYRMLEQGKKIDVTAAISSCSWGVGQVMGSHWKWLGYKSAQDFEATAQKGFTGQLAIMFGFMEKSGVIPHLRRLDWSAVARIWNGPKYATNKYDVKMANAYARHSGKSIPKPTSAGMLRSGSKGQKVRELQALLVRAGYSVNVDGDFGPATERAVKAFQIKNKLEVDGVAGPRTMEELQRFKVTPQEKVAVEPVLENKEVKEGLWSGLGGAAAVTAAKGAVAEARNEIAPYIGNGLVDSINSTLGVVSAILVVAGLGYAAYGVWQRRKSRTGIEEALA